jgi:hypothetical protein
MTWHQGIIEVAFIVVPILVILWVLCDEREREGNSGYVRGSLCGGFGASRPRAACSSSGVAVRRVPAGFFWILFGVFHLDNTAWDDWSHSLVMSVVWATTFAAFFWRLGRRAFVVV